MAAFSPESVVKHRIELEIFGNTKAMDSRNITAISNNKLLLFKSATCFAFLLLRDIIERVQKSDLTTKMSFWKNAK